MKRIEIDLNSRDESGCVLARLSAADHEIEIGDVVTVFQPDDQVTATGRVHHVDRAHDLVTLDVDWTTLT